MAKLTSNGSIKLILAAAAVITLCLTSGGVIWNASKMTGTVAATLEQNCQNDETIHKQVPVLDNRLTRTEEQIKAMNDRFSEFQRQSLENQKEILRALSRP